MAYFTIEQWVALSAMSGVGIIAILRVLAHRFEHDRSVHDLRLRARTLRQDYNARLAAMKANTEEEPIEAEVVEEIETAPLQAAA